MSISYRVDREADLIRIGVGGTLDDLNFVASVRGIAADPGIRPGMALLVDLRDVTTSTVSRTGIVRSAAILHEPGAAFVGARIALVAIEQRQLGDLPYALLGLLPREVRVFGAIEHALDWLGAAVTGAGAAAAARREKLRCG